MASNTETTDYRKYPGYYRKVQDGLTRRMWTGTHPTASFSGLSDLFYVQVGEPKETKTILEKSLGFHCPSCGSKRFRAGNRPGIDECIYCGSEFKVEAHWVPPAPGLVEPTRVSCATMSYHTTAVNRSWSE